MRVIATKRGFFGALREPGDEFEVPQGTEGSWFEPVAVEKPAEAKRAAKPKAEPKAPLEGDKADDLV